MARFDVPFGTGRLRFSLPDACVRLPQPAEVRPLGPVDADRSHLARDIALASKLLVVVNDAFRSTPTRRLLAPFKESLAACAEVQFVVATGMHPPPTREEIEVLLGEFAQYYSVSVHDQTADCHTFGTLSDGTRLELNRLLAWPDRILLVGSVEPHFFAGFTGGPKQLLPGLASRPCTEANHRHATHPECRPMQIGGNPVAEAIGEAGRLFAERLLSIQCVRGPEGWEPFWGGEPDTFKRAASRAREVAECLWEEPLDGLVVVMDHPLDRNLYQLQKGFENHLAVIKEAGFVLLISACTDGVGNDFFGSLARRYPDWRRLPPWEDQPYGLGLHKLYRTAKARERCELFLHSQLPANVVRSVYLEPVDFVQTWLDRRARAARAIGVVESADRRVSSLRSREATEKEKEHA